MKACNLLLILIFGFTLVFPIPTHAETIHVPADHETIQVAINAAENGDSVLVAPGEYVENINFSGKLISVIGNPGNPSEVIINGNENGSVVLFTTGEGEEAVLNGFTITGGNGDVFERGDNFGGGILIFESSPIIKNSICQRNVMQDLGRSEGGGIAIVRGSAVIEHCIVRGNIAGDGGGIAVIWGSSARLLNVEILNNEARSGESSDGGGINITGEGSSVELTNCRVSGNFAGWGAGISFRYGASGVINNCEISNHDAYYGSAVFALQCLLEMSNVTISNNIVSDRLEDIGVLQLSDGALMMTNSIMLNPGEIEITGLYGNLGGQEIDIAYSSIEGGQGGFGDEFAEILWGNGCIDEDPLFADPENGVYNLTPDSPCIDTGNPNDDFDPDGTRADMGAYYFHQQDIQIEQDILDFGHLDCGLQDSLELRIQNVGIVPLSIISQTITQNEPAFLQGLGRGEVVIEPESVHSSWIIFIPTDLVPFEGILEIESDDPDEPVVQVILRGEAELTINSDVSDIPGRFAITEIYPNPFNTKTRVTYSLGYPSKVSAQIFDLSGRVIESLVNEIQPAGQHLITWNSRDAVSGVYLLRMESSDFSDVRKVVLVR
ncbi:MAG: T9SS type A sorting domain-containing protein [Calditrichaeota bacterium]|nr:T9SS type A sorting domain-containing protein [Calditrichota bacterium]